MIWLVIFDPVVTIDPVNFSISCINTGYTRIADWRRVHRLTIACSFTAIWILTSAKEPSHPAAKILPAIYGAWLGADRKESLPFRN